MYKEQLTCADANRQTSPIGIKITATDASVTTTCNIKSNALHTMLKNGICQSYGLRVESIYPYELAQAGVSIGLQAGSSCCENLESATQKVT